MSETIVSCSGGVTLLGGGDVGTRDLSDALSFAPDLVAADGGAAVALAQGRALHAVIGDLDSLSAADRAALDDTLVHKVAEQETTDFEKALSRVAAPFVIGVGFLGRRLDHSLANLNTLVRLGDRRCILLGDADVVLAAPPRLSVALAAGTRVSLFPLTTVEGRSNGLHWPIDGLAMAPWGQHGTSNRVAAEAESMTLAFDGPGMIVILPREALAAVLDGLRAAPTWPPRAPAG